MQKKYFLILVSASFCFSPLGASKNTQGPQQTIQRSTLQAPNNDDLTDDASDDVLPDETPSEKITDEQINTEDTATNSDLNYNDN